jgi:predicted TIM-barrel fold metal-dependent hydrolase
MDRRVFLAASLSAAGPAAAAGEDRPALDVIDTHLHLWDLKRFRLPWLKKIPSLNRDHLLTDYRDATAELTGPGDRTARVVKAVYMEVDLEAGQQAAEAEYVLDLCRRGGTVVAAAVISGRPSSDGFSKYLDQFKGDPHLKGVRQILHVEETPPGYCLDPAFVAGVRLLGRRGLTFDLCLRPGELGDGVKLVDACPDTRFVLDHCGNADVQAKDSSAWKRGMEAMARRKHVVGKVSGIVVSAKAGAWTAEDLAPFVNHTLDVFGPDRVMFGGDWPVCTQKGTLRQWVAALGTVVAGRPEAQQRRLFHDNAARFYGLG